MTRRDFARWLSLGAVGLAAAAGEADAAGAMERFLERIRGDLARFRTEQLPLVETAANRLAETVSGGGRLCIFDFRGAYAAEALGRAGGLMAISQVTPDTVTAQDAVVLITDVASDPRDAAMARAARSAGAYVVAIAPVRRGADGTAALCDHGIDDYVTDDDAAIRLPGLDTPIAPTSGIMNVAILWTLAAAYVEAMERRGRVPSIWVSIKCPDAKERNDRSLARAAREGF